MRDLQLGEQLSFVFVDEEKFRMGSSDLVLPYLGLVVPFQL